MPAPQIQQFSQLTKTIFTSKNIVLPMNWMDMGEAYPDAFNAGDLSVSPNPATNLFREATLNKYHVQTAREVGKSYEHFIEGVSSAISKSIDFWMKTAVFAGVLINGPIGAVLPGNVIGPDITSMIYANSPLATEEERRYSRAVSIAIGSGWRMWHMGLSGVLQYPTFAAFPGPVAPPTPNVPVPVITFCSAGESAVSPGALRAHMDGVVGFQGLHTTDLFDSISKAFNNIFLQFKATTLVQNVLGTGPVPSFVPPAAPVGPVVAGTSIPTPGVFV